ncbi:Pls/PosA family non-ribosomal peptide synthetase [Streptomyces sp. V4-01]|uniref:Pls/PosA family non-ribosomal peptide synthetase n=1 Tax=Actinacidiphila polyblastidii TaxID=3110430 RepID=A0ABU7PB45_9ACTN|nr:Pls/PosA family non-ribosomal peptide synthetase [Streptomyces sp. V4-01]
MGKQIDTLPPDVAGGASAEDTRGARAAGVATVATVEREFGALLAEVTHVGSVAPGDHFFDDLGADSMVMAHFCARVRKSEHLPPVSMKDVYRHPTLAGLAAALVDAAPAVPVRQPEDHDRGSGQQQERPPAASSGRARYVLCGVLQLLAFLGYSYLIALLTVRGYGWIDAGSGAAQVYLRAVVFGLVAFAALCALPVVAKWVLVGRWTPRRFTVWSLDYVRFWIVRTLIRSDPLVLFAGSPLYSLYLRALGARIGRGVTIFSRTVPVCTDLLTVGSGSVIRKDAFFTCYRARDGRIQTGSVTLGAGVVVSEATVLDIDTRMGDAAQLGHASSLHRGQAVPAGEHWHGSPAQRATADFQAVAAAPCGSLRRALHSVVQLLSVLLVYVPLTAGGIGILLAQAPQLASIAQPGPSALGRGSFYGEAVAVSTVLFFGALAVGLLAMATVPRLLNRALTADRVYPLYGFHYGVHRAIALMTNRRFLNRLFGDSSAIVHYLRRLGYDLSRVEQTGSNFGTEVRHESPFMSAVGRGTMIADGLSVNNADFSSTSFRVHRTRVGSRSFLGNRIAYPTRSRAGDDCLLATKVMVPVDGEVREGVGLLGSPSFEIPRSVLRDSSFDRLKSAEELRRRLPAKNRHNAATMAWYLLVRWVYFVMVALLFWVAADLYGSFGVTAVALANVTAVVLSAAYFVLVERVVTFLHPLSPLFCSIYDARFWRRERFWKVPSETHLRVFNGTPYKNLIWRLQGVHLGKRVFDDGCYLTERTLVTIGDDCMLNTGSVIQCHSQEDGTFKSERSVVGSGCTVGVGALVHYGVTVGDNAVIAPDSFLMKGETVPPGARWGGNPAHPLRSAEDGETR